MLSVVIPVFNRPEQAARAIKSVLGQRWTSPEKLEIVAVDDASTEPLQSNVSDHRLRIVRLEQNSGPAAARNAGIAAARGDFIAFLDSDDIWLEDKLRLQYDPFKQSVSVRAANLKASACGFFYPNRKTRQLEARVPKPAQHLADFCSGCWFSPGSTLIVQREAFTIVGMFDERLRRLEDLDWFIRFARQGGQIHVSPYLGAVIAPSNSASTDSVTTSSKIIAAKFAPKDGGGLPNREWGLLQSYLELEAAASLLRQGQIRKGAGNLVSSFLRKPRRQLALQQFWDRSQIIPQAVVAKYREMTRLQ